MKTEDLECIIMISECGSISAAARRLYMSQPQLSTKIRMLESELGVPIFERTHNSVKFTYAGKRILETAKDIRRQVDALSTNLKEIKKETRGQIIIGVSSHRSRILTKVIPLYLEQYPRVEIEIREYTPSSYTGLLMERQIDMAILSADSFNVSPDLEYTFLHNDRLLLFAGKDTGLARRFESGATIHLKDAKDETFILTHKTFGFTSSLDRLFMSQKITPKVMMKVHSIELACQLAVTCNCVAFCKEANPVDTDQLKKEGNYYYISSDECDARLTLAHRKDMYVPQYMQEFIDLIKKTYEE